MTKHITLIILLLLSFMNAGLAQVKYLLPCDELLLKASMDSAIAQVGVIEETGHNDGLKVEQYLSSAGLGKGNPYCAAGVYWCFAVSARALGMPYENIPIKRTGLANEMYSDTKSKGKRTTYKSNIHDLLVWRKKNSNNGHIERVIETQPKGWVVTVGFNTSTKAIKDKSEVEGVFFRRRNIFNPMGRMQIRGIIGFVSNEELGI